MTAPKTYTGVAIALHWILAVLLVGMVFYGWYMEDLREALFAGGEVSIAEVQFAYNAHKTTGLLILILSLGRLAWRLTHPVPALPAGMAGWERFAATATHWAFYVIMIGMPLGGLIAASAAEPPTLLFNNPDLVLPKLPVPQTEGFQDLSGSVHGAGGWAILGLLGLHVAAALKHQFINKDGLIGRMIPFLKG
ncbi:cytochrome b [Maricaulis maris]|uniref:Cytochrome b561 n=1 Tax=Maricaulis maris TaxID=74318 RepID=A0A495D2J3_9PROT|nr:cytochrome b [Maricaulis maris]RKQ95150.1 cytochrome b561 [Maricaulis maris]